MYNDLFCLFDSDYVYLRYIEKNMCSMPDFILWGVTDIPFTKEGLDL